MDSMFSLMRIVHVACGVFWAGTIFFVVWLLEPATRDAGPAGGQVMGALIRRGYLNILPVMAVLTIVSGGWLYWVVSGGLSSAWGHSPMGTSITVGAFAALLGFALGMIKMRPAGLRMRELSGRLAAAEDDGEKAEIMQQMELEKTTIRTNGRFVAVLLFVAVVGMAAARYL